MGRKTKVNIAALWGAIALLCVGFSIPAAASYIPFNTNVNMNIGIGTETPQGAFVVPNGNVGIGTWAPSAPLTVGANAFTVNSTGAIATTGGYTQSGNGINAFTGNIGIGSASPGQKLDVNGTVRMVNFTMSGQTPISGYVLTASDSAGDTTWTSGGAVSGWTIVGNNVYETLSGNVGIGTTAISQGALVVTNGNVGIGTWVPTAPLTVGANAFTVNGTGAIATAGGYTQSGTGTNTLSGTTTFNALGTSILVTGNVGIGSTAPGQALDVTGTVRMVNFTMSGQTPVSGYVLTASDSAGDTTWASASAVGGWSVTGNNVYETAGGNVGIGTTLPGQALDVNGTVRMTFLTMSGQTPVSGYVLTASDSAGDTTWASASAVGGWSVTGNNVYETAGGNVGIGTTLPGQALDVNGTVRMTGLTLTNNGAANGNVLVSNAIGIGTWMPAGTLVTSSQWTTTNVNDVYLSNNGNVGIGTFLTSTAALTVMNGNVGIGTWKPSGALDIKTGTNVLIESGNLGIGSLTPGQALDVNGTVRMVNFTMSGQTPISGYVLTASDSAGDTTWTSGGAVSGWTIVGNNVYETLSGNVGIGTTAISQGALVVTNGNVGIGTWVPTAPLTIGVNAFTVNSTGAIATIGGYTQSGIGINAFTGNVGISSTAPGQALDVNGTIRTTAFAMSGQTPISGYVLTASDSAGDTTWTSGGAVSGWTIVGNNVYETFSGNVGIGTTAISQGALVVTNGNVGIGTWVPTAPLTVGVNAFTVNSTGAIATTGGYTQSGNGINTFGGNVGIGSTAPGQSLDVTGTVRMTGLTLTGNGAANGNVLVTNAIGIGTWMSPTTLVTSSQWITDNTNDVYLPLSGNVGLGTFLTSTAAFTVMNGNIGIGTWKPAGALDIKTGTNVLIESGNLGIGSLTPGQALDVNGTVRMTNFTMSGQTPISGYVLTASDSAGDTTWTSGPAVAGWTISGNNVYESLSGNVGIGTTSVTQGALVVTNGNVGIGTWAPNALLSVNGPAVIGAASGYVSGGYNPSNGLLVQGNVGVGTFDTTNYTFNVGGTAQIGGGYLSLGLPGVNLNGIALAQTASTLRLTNTNNIAGSLGVTVSGTGSNVGINTTQLSGGSVLVVNGGVSIGTSSSSTSYFTTAAPAGGMIVAGNVGIGSLTPGQALDVAGTIRTTAFAMSGQTPISGYVLTASDSAGNTTWSSAPSVAGWTISGNNVYESLGGNVGIGTTLLTTSALTVMNGNVGIGTWVPAAPLAIGVNAFTVNSTGAIATSGGYTQSGNGINAFTGNVGIGSSSPGQALDVTGTVRMTNFTMSGQTPISGYVLTASDSAGDTTWTSGGAVSGWTIVGNNVYETFSGNVGIGTTAISQGALVVTNGNVGIGTWVPTAPLTVGVNAFTVNSTGAIATTGGYTQSGNGINTFGGNVGIGSTAPGQSLDVTGTVRMTNFTMSGQTPISGYVLTASDSAGDTTWTSGGAVSGWTIVGNNVYETLGGNVGIGTITTAGGSLIVKGGNVGIGSAWPGQLVDVQGTVRAIAFVGDGSGITGISGAIGGLVSGYIPRASSSTTIVDGTMFDNGNIGIGSAAPGQTLDVQGTIRALAGIINGNLGIGSAAPGQRLDVTGTVRTTFLTMSGQTPISGYVLTASDSAGDTTWSSGGAVSGWTVSGNNVYETFSGNVGIGTTLLTTSALTVMNGNVGIGTWLPQALLTVNGNSILGGVASTPGSITSSGTYSLAGGYISGSSASGTITSSGRGSLAFGDSNTGGTANPTSMISNADGSIAMGDIVFGGTLQATGNGAIAMGLVNLGTLTSSGPGSIAMGFASGTLQATGNGSVAIGTNVQAINNDSFALGENVINPLANSFMVGFNASTNPTLTVTATGVGIGTWLPGGGLIVLPANSGNVGIGSLAPGQALDVQGTVRTTAFTMSGQTPISGYVMTASDSAGDTTWTSGSAVSGWTVSGNNVYETLNGNVGIGSAWPGQSVDVQGTVRALYFVGNGTGITGINTGGWSQSGTNIYTVTGSNNVGIGTLTPQAGFVVTNGNVGIGTWTAANPLSIVGGVSIGTTGMANTLAPANGLLVSGNVGIGSAAPGQALDVNGTVRTIAFAMSGQTPISGYVLTASDSAGNTTWTSGPAVAGWTISGNNVYESLSGNVGIGTTSVTQGALVVTNGNVGIGTWAPAGLFQINQPAASPFAVTSAGNVGIGTITPQGALAVTSGNVGIGTWVPRNILDVVGGNIGIGTGYNLIGIGTTSTILTLRNDVQSIYLGWQSGASTTLGALSNSAVGNQTLMNNTTGTGNSAMGQGDLFSNTTGNYNAAIGYQALYENITGSFNAAMGSDALYFNTTGSNNTAMGATSLFYNTASNNTALGNQAGEYVTGGVAQNALSSSSIYIGFNTMAFANGDTDEIVIGNAAVGIGSNSVELGSSAVVTTQLQGNIGIGTFAPLGKLIVTGGNVGIGSLAPGQTLDVTGTVRTTAFAMSGQTPISGYVLTASDSAGNTTWTSGPAVAGWTISGNNVYESLSGNVGIGTTSVTQGALVVTNGNVGIGTWAPAGLFQINKPAASPFAVTSAGNVGIGTITPQAGLAITNGNVGIGTWTAANPLSIVGGVSIGTTGMANTPAPANGLLVSGNVGVGSAAPGQALDVNGTVRAIAFIGNGSGLTGINSGGWIQSGTNVYTQTGSNNVGIGTTTPQGGFVVTNGNVGIGTWAPGHLLDVYGPNGGNWAFFGDAGTSPAPGLLFGATGSDSGSQIQFMRDNGTASLTISNSSGAGPNSVISAADNLNITYNTNNLSRILTFINNAAEVARFDANGNLGIGSTAPGQLLDVSGTVRTKAFTMSGQTPISGYVLTASDSAGDTTWTSGGAVSGWTVSGNNVYETFNGNVGIGTTILQTALTVNGNVGIGTWTAGGGSLIVEGGNVGIGSVWPGQLVDVKGTVRALYFVGDGSGITGINSGGWVQSGTNVYTQTGSNNVGIGTITPQGGLVVTNGNVGIGTWAPANKLEVVGGNIGIGTQYNLVGIGTTTTILSLEGDTSSIYLGWQAGANATGLTRGNTAVGNQALYFNTIGSGNSALGQGALYTNTIGTSNSAFGQNSLYSNTTGIQNTAMGLNALYTNNIGTGNTAVGYSSLVANTTGIANTAMGASALGGITTGTNNSALGDEAGSSITGGSPNQTSGSSVYLGYQTEALQDADTNEIVIGYQAVGIGNNSVEIGNNLITKTQLQGNVGIGTIAFNGKLIVLGGNVGIGSSAPGQTLDVTGTVRATAFTMSGQTPISGYVLTASDSAGDTTWTSGEAVSGWTVSGNNVYEAFGGNVGIGTTAVTQAALAVTNGNVGIGTWAPGGALVVQNGNVGFGVTVPVDKLSVSADATLGSGSPRDGLGNGSGQIMIQGSTNTNQRMILGYDTASDFGFVTAGIDSTAYKPLVLQPVDGFGNGGNVGIGTTGPLGKLVVWGGNVGIGTRVPGQALDVNGTVRTAFLTMSGQTPISGYVMTASDSAGDTTWTSAGAVSGWTVTGSNVYETLNGNVGIGTLNPSGGKLIVSGGNVGVGSLTPGQLVDVQGTVRALYFVGNGTGITGINAGGWTQSGTNVYTSTGSNNVGIGTTTPQGGLVVTNGNVGVGTWAPLAAIQVGFPGLVSGAPSQVYFANASSTAGYPQFLGQWPSAGSWGIGPATNVNGDFNLEIGPSSNTPGNPWAAGGTLNLVIPAGNVGIGTIATSTSALTIMNGNVGIGTWVADSGSLIIKSGNVGIGTIRPGQALDVNGTIRTANFTMSGQTPISGYVLTASDSAGDTTWTSGSSVSGWTISGNNVYESLSGNVGIGTTSVTQGALLVTNGNVGIGTWVPVDLFQVGKFKSSSSGFEIDSNGNVGIGTTITSNGALSVLSGNVGIGTWVPNTALEVGFFENSAGSPAQLFLGNNSNTQGYPQLIANWAEPGLWGLGPATASVTDNTLLIGAVNDPGLPWNSTQVNLLTTGNIGIGTITTTGMNASLYVPNGNVGIGSLTPGQKVDVQGTVRALFFVGNGTGITGINAGGWTQSGTNVYTSTGSNNVGIGTTTPQGGLVVTNGNVGVGTWAPINTLDVNGGSAFGSYAGKNTASANGMIISGNVGIGTILAQGPLQVRTGTDQNGFFQTNQNLANGVAFSAVNDKNSANVDLELRGSVVQLSSIGNNPVNILTNDSLNSQNTIRFIVDGSGNVSIGTTPFNAKLGIMGNIGIGTVGNGDNFLTTAPPNGGMIIEGNVGIGSVSPGQKLDVQGTVRTAFFTMSGQTPISGYVMTASDSAGNTTWTSGGAVSGWTVSGINVYETLNGNVGIGSTVPGQSLDVQGTARVSGNVGIGSSITDSSGTQRLTITASTVEINLQ